MEVSYLLNGLVDILFSSSQKSLNLKNNLSFRRLKRKSDKTNLLGKTNISSQPKRNFLLGQYTPKGKPFPQNKSKTSLHVPYNETNQLKITKEYLEMVPLNLGNKKLKEVQQSQHIFTILYFGDSLESDGTSRSAQCNNNVQG